jgi:hypothetical protein
MSMGIIVISKGSLKRRARGGRKTQQGQTYLLSLNLGGYLLQGDRIMILRLRTAWTTQ